MTRLLFLTDSHVRGTNPAGRTDRFFEAICRKLAWAVSTANELKVAAIIHGGDLFDAPNPSEDVAGMVGQILAKAEMPVYIVPGNHDLFGYQIHSLPHTKLGLLARSIPHVHLLHRGAPPVRIGSVELVGQEYHPHIDTGDMNDFRHGGEGPHRILVYHGQLLDREPGIPMPHTLIENVKTDADLVLAGHYHPGWRPRMNGQGALFWNPGSLARNEAQAYNLDRLPEVLLIEARTWGDSPLTITPIVVAPAEPGRTVLTTAHLTVARSRSEAIMAFRETLRNSTVTAAEGDLLAVVGEGVPKAVLDRAWDSLAAIHSDRLVTEQRRFASLVVEQFQSHIQSNLLFAAGITAIVGPSDAGKTALLRALRWVTQDQPRSTGFIRNGAVRATVTLNLTDGGQIIRTRTASSAGSLEINGTEYRGFARNLPPDLWQAHGITPIDAQGIRLLPSFALQHDPPFLLSLSPGQRAQAIAPLGGAERAEAAVRAIAGDQVRLSTQTRDAERRLEALTVEVTSLDGAIARRDELRQADQLARKADQIGIRVTTLRQFIGRLETIQSTRKGLEGALQGTPDGALAGQLAERIRSIFTQVKRAKQVLHRLDQLRADHQKFSVLVRADLSPLIVQILQLKQKQERLARYQRTLLLLADGKVGLATAIETHQAELQTLLAAYEAHVATGSLCPRCHQPLPREAI